MRAVLVRLIASRRGFRAGLRLAAAGRFLRPAVRRLPGIGPKLDAMLALAPKSIPAPGLTQKPGVYPPPTAARPLRRMALLGGCAEAVLAPQINAVTIRVLNRAGIEVVIPNGEGCCGSLAHHMGVEKRALVQARADIDAWTREIEGEGLEAIVVTASGVRRDNQGLRLPHARRPDLRKKSRARRGARARRRRGGRQPRSRLHSSAPACCRLSCRLFAPARAEDRRPAQGAAAPRGIRRPSDTRGASVLRVGRRPTTSCSRKSPTRCATARSPTSLASSPTSSPPATSAA